jgi:Glycosyl transferase family 2
MDITVCVSTIPPRAGQLTRALASVVAQTLQPHCIVVEYDHGREGAASVKNRALAKVDTPLVAFLDDDDEFLPHHLKALRDCMVDEHAHLVYSVPVVPQAPAYTRDPAHHYWVPFDPAPLRRESFIQTTVLVRTSVIRDGGGFWKPEGSPYDDWGMALGVLSVGGTIVHLPMETFIWNHNGLNTSGDPTRW